MATLAVPAAAPLVASLRSNRVAQDGGRVTSVVVLPATSNSNFFLASLHHGRDIHQHGRPVVHISPSPTPRWLQVRVFQLHEKLRSRQNSEAQEIQCQSSRAQHPHCSTWRTRLQQRVSSSRIWLGSSSVMPSSFRGFNSTRRLLSNRPIFTTQMVQANIGLSEPHATNLASVPEEELLKLEDQALPLESTLRRELDVNDFLMSKLPSHPKLHRGCLENGLHYVILPNKVPPNRFEAHMEMHVGSVDEAEHEQGIAHMIEHVAFLGSKMREKLLGTGGHLNAYTDFHHTVFHVHSPVTTQGTNEPLLPLVLEVLHEIAFKPRFLSSQVEEERMAVLAELQLMNTIEYKVDCQLLQQLHSENMLGYRFPIGLEEQIKKWDLETIKAFHERWYFPGNGTLFVVGDIGNISCTSEMIEAQFGSTPARVHVSTHTSHENINHAAMTATTREEWHSVRPPVRHNWSLPGGSNQQLKKPFVFQHELLQNFSISLFCKTPVQKVQMYSDLRDVLMRQIVLSTLRFRVNNHYMTANPPFNAIELDHSDSGREGCAVSTLTITAEPKHWEGAVKVGVQEVRRLHMFGVTRGELAQYLNALPKDSEHLAAMIDNVPSLYNLDFIMESDALGHTVMDQQQGPESLLAVAETVTLEDVNRAGASMLEYIASYGDPTAPIPAAIVACVPKTIYVKDGRDTNFDITPDAILNAIAAGLNEPLASEPELEVPTEQVSPIELESLHMQWQPQFVPVTDEGSAGVRHTDERACAYIAGAAPNRWGFLSDGHDLNTLIQPVPPSLSEEQARLLALLGVEVIRHHSNPFCQKRMQHPVYACFSGVKEEDDTFSESFAIEEGIFEDAFPQRQDDYEVKVESNDRASLVPDDWKALQEELSRSKWEKKREVIDNLVERARQKQAQRRLTIAEGNAGHKAYQQRHFPRVLPEQAEAKTSYGVKKMIEEELYKEIFDTDEDDITQDMLGDETASDSDKDEPETQINYASSLPALRATPRNPRLALGGSTFDEVARKFQEQEEDIEENLIESNSKDNDAESKEVSSSQLLSNKEKAMLRSSNFSCTKVSSEKWSALHTLAVSGQINVVDQLLRRGADINAFDMDGVTALHKAVLTGRESMVRHLLKSGANALARDRVGATALHYAVQTANGNLVRLLTRNGINVNSPDNEGWTPLHVAVQSGRTDIIRLLLSRGADINIPNQDGNSPLDMALSFGKGFGYYHVVTTLKKASQKVQGLMQFAVSSEDRS